MAIYDMRAAQDYKFGQLTAGITSLDTTLASANFTSLPSDLTTTKYMPITLADDTAGLYETVWVTAHSGGSTSVTVVRGREGSTARAWATGSTWRCAPTIRDGMVVATRAGLPSDAHLGLRATVSDESVVVEKTAAGWSDSAPHQPGRKHGWIQLGAAAASGTGDIKITGWSPSAGNATIATMSSGNLLLNRAGVWSIYFQGDSDAANLGTSKLSLQWNSGALTPTMALLCDQRYRGSGVGGAGTLFQSVSWTGYATTAHVAAPISCYISQTTSPALSVNYNFYLHVEYLGA